MSMLLALAAAAAAPQPGELKTFRDWIVGCDNGRVCQAVALIPESEDGEHYLALVLTRGPEAQAKAELRWTAADGPPRPATLTIDGKAVAQSAGTAIVIDPALATALAAGGTAEVATTPGGKVGDASLGGLAAAMRYIDDKQNRVGTVTALVAKGTAKIVPPPPTLPVVALPAADRRPPRTLSVARVTQLIGPDVAKCEYSTAKVEPEAYRLDARTSLVTVVHPCGNGAYNYFSSAFLVDEAGKVRAATFDADKPNPKDGENLGLVNAGYDPKTRRLSSFIKGRGLGDCGSGQAFAWDGTQFRLAEQTEMGECRGAMDYIRTWRAIVR
jgi:Protein of unknown function (DUF1176)